MSAQGPRVAVFAFDLNEPSQVKSIRAMRAAGAEVQSFSFRRANMQPESPPDWRDHPLGHSVNGVGPRRIAAIAGAALRLARHGDVLRQSDVIVARNLDLALLTLWARALARSRAKLVYQCLDIHSMMTAPGIAGRLARLAERAVLARCVRLVVSAPRFLDAHFGPVQGYAGNSVVLENRIWWPGPPPPRPLAGAPRQADAPIRLGWVGTLRCPQTLRLLAGTARLMGPGVRIVLRGTVHRHQLPDFDRVLSAHPNMVFEGGYAYPGGLGRAYAGLDCVWAQDLWQRGGNSDWLLPNRIYEAGYFGCPALALEGTATGDKVAGDGTGLVLPRATPAALAGLLARNRDGLACLRRRLLAMPGDAFCLSHASVSAMLDLPRQQADEGVANARPA